jgi:plastocyanin
MPRLRHFLYAAGRFILTGSDQTPSAANSRACSSTHGLFAHGRKPPGIRRALRVIWLLSSLASTPGLAENTNNAGTAPVASVTMDHNMFIPAEITVVPGTTVTWVNSEAMPHTVVDQNKGFRSKTIVKDASFSFTFTTAGDYNYLCSIHPGMKGKIIVKPAG